MVGVDNNVNSGPKVSGTCFGKFEKSTQIDPKMFIFGGGGLGSLVVGRRSLVELRRDVTMLSNGSEAKSYHGKSGGDSCGCDGDSVGFGGETLHGITRETAARI